MKAYRNVMFAVGILILIFFLNFSKSNTMSVISNSLKMDYSGTNSLFIEYENPLKFHWITNVEDVGSYELIGANGKLIAKGETESKRPHAVSIDYEIENGAIFKFGGVKDGMHEITLKEKQPLSRPFFKNVDSIYVIGDVHGRYDQLTNLLQKSKLIDDELNWIAGTSHMVFLGDLFDRGDDVTKVLWFIYELEEKAKAVGGKVHLVLGNHEIMVMSKDLRYLSRKEANIPFAHKVTYDYLFHPTKSVLGSWLTSKTSVLKIDNAIFAHGGVVELEANSLGEYNEKVSTQLKDPMFLDIMEEYPDSTKYDSMAWERMRYFFYREDGPFWFRGYVQTDTLAPELKKMLRTYDSKVHVVAHTIQKTITSRYNGKLLTTDLEDAATELLLMVRDKRKYDNFKFDSEGKKSKVEKN